MSERKERTGDELLAALDGWQFTSAYRRRVQEVELLKHNYDMLRHTYEDLVVDNGRVEELLKEIRTTLHLPMTKREKMGYGNYERRCLKEVEDLLDRLAIRKKK